MRVLSTKLKTGDTVRNTVLNKTGVIKVVILGGYGIVLQVKTDEGIKEWKSKVVELVELSDTELNNEANTMSVKLKTTIELELQPFPIPSHVHVVAQTVKRQDGWKEPDSISLENLDAETLDRLCYNFRIAVFERAGKQEPATISIVK